MSNLTRSTPHTKKNTFAPAPPADGPTLVIPEQPVPGSVCDAVDRLIRSLQNEFGVDHAFEIVARGTIIASSNARLVIDPRSAIIPETTYTR